MFAARRYPIRTALVWTWDFIAYSFVFAAVVFGLYHGMGWTWLALPGTVLSVLGTAVSFYLGFKGNAAYERLWEARKIWGGIVNSSRTWGVFVRDYVTTPLGDDTAQRAELQAIHAELVDRHVAWLGALRTQLRRAKSWETTVPSARRQRKDLGTEDMSDARLRARIEPLLDPEELEWAMARKNVATQLMATQSRRLRELHRQGLIDDFRHIAMGGLVEEFYTLQGKAERIKNFPLPRQYASANSWFVTIFVFSVPFAMVPLFAELDAPIAPWLAVPCSSLLAWIFLSWNKIADWSENPFDGLGNDIPIDALSRTIEIDLREMLGQGDLPKAIEPQQDILM